MQIKAAYRSLYPKEVFTLGHIILLQLIGKVTYYVCWIALVCGGLLHLNIATKLFLGMSLSKRNLFEVGAVCFLICIASEPEPTPCPETSFPPL